MACRGVAALRGANRGTGRPLYRVGRVELAAWRVLFATEPHAETQAVEEAEARKVLWLRTRGAPPYIGWARHDRQLLGGTTPYTG